MFIDFDYDEGIEINTCLSCGHEMYHEALALCDDCYTALCEQEGFYLQPLLNGR